MKIDNWEQFFSNMTSEIALVRAELLELADWYRNGEGSPLDTTIGSPASDVKWGINSLTRTVHSIHEQALQAKKVADAVTNSAISKDAENCAAYLAVVQSSDKWERFDAAVHNVLLRHNGEHATATLRMLLAGAYHAIAPHDERGHQRIKKR